MRTIRYLVAGSLLAAAVTVVSGQTPPDSGAGVDKIFSRWTKTTPGCTVGAAVGGQTVLSKAYGMADLEREVPNTPDTIFEAGSVSKQFTAAAVLLLARDGKLSLEDPVRKYIPELHDYKTPLTIRHMLNHTSGLRDWGSLAGIAGWPRTTRVHTHAHVVEILGRQRGLNFPSGTRYSYSNSGYNLAAVLVSRVSGMSFVDFTRTRIFEPLSMTRTSWRDDHTRIVKQRALAYTDRQGSFSTNMPFENVHGNGGLLTTVGDLLKWNENFTEHKIGDASFVTEQERAGKFNDGRAHGYALGLMVGAFRGVRQVDHSGSTAGYNAHLSRYPDQRVSVAVLCNATSGSATAYARSVAEIFLADRLKSTTQTATHTLTEAEATRLAGLYRDVAEATTMTITRDQSGLRAGGASLTAMSPSRFVAGNTTFEFDAKRMRVTDQYGTVETYERVDPAKPTREHLSALAGSYTSDEIETSLTVALDGDALVIKRRPDTTFRLTPVYADAFTGGGLGFVVFRRDAGGRVTSMSVMQDRVWDLRFARIQSSKVPTFQGANVLGSTVQVMRSRP